MEALYYEMIHLMAKMHFEDNVAADSMGTYYYENFI